MADINTEKRYDEDGIEMVASKKEILGYACGAPGQNLMSQFINNSLNFTDSGKR